MIFTIFVADYFDTLAAEINSLWPAPWSTMKVLFLISRYSPFLDGSVTLAVGFLPSTSSITVCTSLVEIQSWSAGIGQVVSHLLLTYRAYALVGRTRLSAIILSLLALVMVALSLSFIGTAQQNTPEMAISIGFEIPQRFSNLDRDIAFLVHSSRGTTLCITVFAFDTVLFGVICWAKVKKYKQERNWLIRKIYRDAFLYYLLLFVVYVSTLLVAFLLNESTTGMIITIPRYFASIVSSRIILNIRQYAHAQKTSADTGLTGIGGGTTQPVSGLRFANSGHCQMISAVDTELRLY